MDFTLSNFGTNFTSDYDTENLNKELSVLLKNNDSITLDFQNINVMTTTAVKSILQPIVNAYGYDNFFKKIIFKNVTEDMKIIIGTAVNGLEH